MNMFPHLSTRFRARFSFFGPHQFSRAFPRSSPFGFNPRRREFSSSRSNRDIFFVAFPALKAQLLTLTRVSLVALPFIYRYRLWKKYPRMSLTLLQIPVFTMCIVAALALDQAPRTQRWRLVLMTAREELEWARSRFDEFLKTDGPLLLKEDDPRVQQVQRISERILNVLDDSDIESRIVSAASVARGPVTAKREEQSALLHREFPPSASILTDAAMPFILESSNPTKVFHDSKWKLYVVDLPRINAFALPTKEIVVYTGLIDLLEDDTLLSAVLAHEVSHVTQRHAAENAGFLSVVTIAFDILRGITFAFTMSFPVVADASASIFNLMNDMLAGRAYSRKLEKEADALGLEFMAKAGYHPAAALDLWDVMHAVEKDAAASGHGMAIQDRLTLLRTHPTSAQRQKDIEKLLPKAMKLYEQSPYRSKAAVQRPVDASLSLESGSR